VVHGGCRGVPHAACVRLRIVANGVEVEYRDRGFPFNPLDAPPPGLAAPLMERQAGGLGVHLVREIMQDVRYHRSANGNELTMLRRMDPK
jgi:anti-sigma regulatory factor (Ser/Thr protein kinase)